MKTADHETLDEDEQAQRAGTTALGPEVRRKLRELTHAYLLRPEPDYWLVAADLLEESGLGDEAALWRRRGQWFGPIREVLDECLAEEVIEARGRRYAGPIRTARLPGPLRVAVRMCRRRWSVRVLLPTVAGVSLAFTHPASKAAGYWAVISKDGDRFHNEKILRLIDALHNHLL
jgi:hypothetical protein